MTRSWSKFRDDAREYPSWHIRRDNASAFCGLPLPLDKALDHEAAAPPDDRATCNTCYRREREYQPPKDRDDDQGN